MVNKEMVKYYKGHRDLLADLIIRIKNAIMNKSREVIVVKNKLVSGIVKVLKEEGYILDYSELEPNGILIKLKYKEGISSIKFIKGSNKLSPIVKAREIKPIVNGLGTLILSTNKGVIGDKQALREGIGGHRLVVVY